MTFEYLTIGLPILTFLILYVAINLDKEHGLLKAAFLLTGMWIIYGTMGIIRGLAEADASLALGTSDIVDSIFLAFGILAIVTSLYSVLYLMVAWLIRSGLIKDRGRNGT